MSSYKLLIKKNKKRTKTLKASEGCNLAAE